MRNYQDLQVWTKAHAHSSYTDYRELFPVRKCMESQLNCVVQRHLLGPTWPRVAGIRQIMN